MGTKWWVLKSQQENKLNIAEMSYYDRWVDNPSKIWLGMNVLEVGVLPVVEKMVVPH